MKPKNPLQRLRDDLHPSKGAKERIRATFEANMRAPILLTEARKDLKPSTETKDTVWARVSSSLQPTAATVLDRVRGILTPSDDIVLALKSRLMPQLAPVTASARREQRLKWVASFAVIALIVRMAPQLFLAPQGIAESFVTLIPTRGEVSVFSGQFWTEVREPIELEPGMIVRTYEDGEASIVFHDDGVMRLGTSTVLELYDTIDRLQQSDMSQTTAMLLAGRVWVQGLIPQHLAGLSVDTEYGVVTVREGSVSIEKKNLVDVRVYNRRAVVMHEGQRSVLVQGERTQMWDGNVLTVQTFSQKSYTDPWPDQNLARDAVHRREIAQLQHERRIARAGILPTSPLYPVKRAAEKVDFLFTFNKDTRTQKLLQQADTRLSEAAALIAQGETETVSGAPLEEYKETLVAVAAGSGSNGLAPFLVQQSLTEATADVAALLPSDQAYPLKKAVLEVSVNVTSTNVADEAQEELLTDTIAALQDSLQQRNVVSVSQQWMDIQQQLAMTGTVLSEETRKEVDAQLRTFAVAINDQLTDEEGLDPSVAEGIQPYLPVQVEPEPAPLTDEDILRVVHDIYRRIFLYTMEQSRINQFTKELQTLNGHPEEGRILRKLQQELPDGPERFPDRIKRAILKLRWEKAVE